MRRGLSLLEVVVALGLFALLMAAALESFGGMSGYVDQESTQNDLLLEGRHVVAAVVADLGDSAWFVPPDADGNGVARPPWGGDQHDLDALQDPAKDRSLRYYPYVNVQTATGWGRAFPAHRRAASEVPDLSRFATLPAEHRLASQEIIFLKARTAAASATPAAPPPLDFDQPIAPIATWTANRDGVAAPSLAMTVSGSGVSAVVSDLPLAWESDLAAPDNANPDQLREYTYVVVPNPATGKAQLERRFRNAGGAVETDAIVARDVDRIVFDTYRTASNLNVNQVRVTAWLSRELERQPGLFQTLRVEATIALRSTVDPEFSLDLSSWLDPGASGMAPH